MPRTDEADLIMANVAFPWRKSYDRWTRLIVYNNKRHDLVLRKEEEGVNWSLQETDLNSYFDYNPLNRYSVVMFSVYFLENIVEEFLTRHKFRLSDSKFEYLK
jgi:hypothetical protein